MTRNAYQRLYDMIISFGTEEYIDNKKKLVRYNFFKDELNVGQNAIYGLDIPLMRLVHVLKAASEGYGPEKRVILLHGPVGSSKSTIARLLKQGAEHYSRSPEGALYSFDWMNLEGTGLAGKETERFPSPMNEEPLRLIPPDWREKAIGELGLGNEQFKVRVDGDLDPASRFILKTLMTRYDGDWSKMMANHIRCRRVVLSEKDRVGIGTFQPKDEKNQDSTELTGDINYRKIAEFGSDSDPRAFNFDGEFNIANRGIIEFVEMLKLDVAFLYDLLGASQEHRDQAEEVRADRHRRGHPRSHQRGRVQEAPEQRVHGSPARPHDQDRHPLHHEADRGDQDLREGLQHRQDQGQAHRPAHARSRGDVGGDDAPRGPEEAQPVARAEDEAVRRQGAARVTRRTR